MSLKKRIDSLYAKIDEVQESMQHFRISVAESSAPRQAAQSASTDFKSIEHIPAKDDKKLKAESCKPSTLRCHYKPKEPLTIASPGIPTKESINVINSEIDEFLGDLKSNGFVLPATQSTIGQRLSLLEGEEHILSPVRETPESYPGGFNPMTLTYSLPKVNASTKPSLQEPPMPAAKPRKEAPSAAWSRLGSPAYHFVDEDKFVRK